MDVPVFGRRKWVEIFAGLGLGRDGSRGVFAAACPVREERQ